MIKITLDGEPISKERPRFSKYGTYDPQKNQKNAAKFQVLDQISRHPILPFPSNIPVEIEIIFYFSIPKGKENLHSWGLLDHVSKPDYDNTEKFILDVLSGIIYSDDRQVHIAHARKEYSDKPRTEILIMAKKSDVSDQVKEVLSVISSDHFCEIASSMALMADCHMVNGLDHQRDYEEIAFLILEFAEKHADSLKKLNKKFPGLAKVLKEKLENR